MKTIELSERDFKLLEESLDNPPEPNQALVDLCRPRAKTPLEVVGEAFKKQNEEAKKLKELHQTLVDAGVVVGKSPKKKEKGSSYFFGVCI